MTVEEIMKMSPDTIMRLTEKELRLVTQTLVNASNKRVSRLGSSEIGRQSPAFQKAVARSAGSEKAFSTAGKNLNQLRNEFSSARGFLSMKSSSIREWNKQVKKDEKQLGVHFDKGGGDGGVSLSDFYKGFRQLLEMTDALGLHGMGSQEQKQMFGETVKGYQDTLGTFVSSESIVESAVNYMIGQVNEEYENLQEEYSNDFSDIWG